uniref:S8 family peptidase n=1 Tax=Lachnospira sp. TaxID=2049031 RepID=UPI0040294378
MSIIWWNMNQKIENLLNVSLDATREELESSESLSTGFNWRDNTWEIIVRYTGNLENIKANYNVYVRELLFNYAIIVTDKATIELISQEPQIVYVEKPKSLYFQLERAKSAACASNVRVGQPGAYGYKNISRNINESISENTSGNIGSGQTGQGIGGIADNGIQYLSGKGVITAIIDTGIDIYSSEFRNADGSTRILDIYDQTLQREYSAADIDAFIGKDRNVYTGRDISQEENEGIPAFDNIQHGTNVAVIACGKSGVAYESDIIVVKMGYSYNNQFPRTTSLMDAIDYIIRKAMEYNRPVAINISYGMNYGDHNGNTLLESYINAAASGYKCSICIGSGNEADKAVHYGGTIKNAQTDTVEIAVGEYQSSIDIQIWKYYWDDIRVTLISPDGTERVIVTHGKISRYTLGGTNVISLSGEPSPYNLYQEIYINLQLQGSYITSGIWKIQLYGENVRQGTYNIWLPASVSLNRSTGVIRPVAYDTITIPATAGGCISVGAYNSYTGAYAAFSGRGSALTDVLTAGIKPDILAPGVDISIRRDTRQGVVYTSVTGTSYATPFVTGAAALLMQWGIVMGNDRFMYGEKLKAYLRSGARQLDGVTQTPNPVTGYGALCVEDSIK